MEYLSNVLDDYLLTATKTGGKAINIDSISQKTLTVDLPNLFRKLVHDSGFPIERYKFKGSYGQVPLNITETPWVATFDTRVTTSAQKGFDIVLLFAKDMKSCVLSLNQGYKAFTDEFKKESLALKKIQQTAEKARGNLAPIAGAVYGPIHLNSDTSNARGYELGAIASYIYHRDSLPSQDEFAMNYLSLLKSYDQLYQIAGSDLISLQALTDSEFQAEVETSLTLDDAELTMNEEVGPESKPKLLASIAGVRYKRDVYKSKRAIKKSGYLCQVDPNHKSFISNVTKKMYVEAHHLVPMSVQDRFENSLDVLPNILSLCPNCHRMIHHGTQQDKSTLIKRLFSIRSKEISEKGIQITEAELINIYKKSIDETD